MQKEYENKLLVEAREEIQSLRKSLGYFKKKIEENKVKLDEISEIIVKFNGLDYSSDNAFVKIKEITRIFFPEVFVDNFARRKYFEKQIKKLNN